MRHVSPTEGFHPCRISLESVGVDEDLDDQDSEEHVAEEVSQKLGSAVSSDAGCQLGDELTMGPLLTNAASQSTAFSSK